MALKVEDLNQNSIIVIEAYVSPTIQSLANAKRQELIKLVEKIKLQFQTEDIVLMGDFNLPKKQINS